MPFTSHVFLFVFLPLTLAVYALAPRRLRLAVLALASLTFCVWAGAWFVAPLLAVAVVDHACSRVLARPQETRGRRVALAVSIMCNVGLLAVLKYAEFVRANLDAVVRALGLGGLGEPGTLALAVPLGISFYTFQSLAYTIDLYHRRIEPARSLVEYLTFLAFFARLTAGPIVRFAQGAGQLRAPAFSTAAFARGALFFSLGLAKKVLLANPCGTAADAAFAAAAPCPLDAWFGLVAYAFQIYFDFSGYTDMAIGLGLLFGIELPANFDRPYRARSITEFWRRWHITLSNWLRDYLFLPIAYAAARRLEHLRLSPRAEEYASYVASALLTMGLAGLWHGAAWTFLIWGLVHGAAMALERLIGKRRFYKRTPDLVKTIVTFLIVLLAWVFFRSASLAEALRYIGCLAGLGSAPPSPLLGALLYTPYQVAVMAAAALVTWAGVPTASFVARATALRAAVALVLLVVAIVMTFVQSYTPFLYSVF